MSLFIRHQAEDAVVDKSFFKARDLPAIRRLEKVLQLEQRRAWLIGEAAKGNRQYKKIHLIASPLNPVSGSRHEDYNCLYSSLQQSFNIESEDSQYQANIRNESTELVVTLAPPYFSV